MMSFVDYDCLEVVWVEFRQTFRLQQGLVGCHSTMHRTKTSCQQLSQCIRKQKNAHISFARGTVLDPLLDLHGPVREQLLCLGSCLSS